MLSSLCYSFLTIVPDEKSEYVVALLLLLISVSALAQTTHKQGQGSVLLPAEEVKAIREGTIVSTYLRNDNAGPTNAAIHDGAR